MLMWKNTAEAKNKENMLVLHVDLHRSKYLTSAPGL